MVVSFDTTNEATLRHNTKIGREYTRKNGQLLKLLSNYNKR